MWVLEMAEGWERQPLFPHKIFYTAGKLWGLPPKNFPGKKLSGLQRESKYVLLLNQLRNTFFLSNKWGTPKSGGYQNISLFILYPAITCR
jgi:hypothetical protein